MRKALELKSRDDERLSRRCRRLSEDCSQKELEAGKRESEVACSSISTSDKDVKVGEKCFVNL
ncbi:hypothetical protein F8388_023864 [Cannabis sativa]|uniref:Uncharacterized protein n=1 Tax=Cannabis sativa TaxID=3483 RepID=A0A7J6HWW9_CANSA|nr:hypothetical protein F8388_023864 [Cannabis sativa]KAF4399319.1 hypothetical protein G4B88_022402 [Cannabis sativa]